MTDGILVVVSGFSGSGKGTLMKKLVSEYDNYALSVSATTRTPRTGEQEGREYFFKSRQEFEKLIENDELIEYASFCNNYYGTPRDYVLEQRKNGKDVILEIEVQGALKVKEKYPDAMLIFITPPNADILKDRLVNRGTECADAIKARLQQAVWEAGCMDKYDYVLINDDLDRAVKELNEIIVKRGALKTNNTEFIEKIKDDLKTIFREEEKMLHPSYSELIANADVDPGEAPVLQSRYSIVIASAKRARQIIDGDVPEVKADGKKPLSIAVEELFEQKVRILNDDPDNKA